MDFRKTTRAGFSCVGLCPPAAQIDVSHRQDIALFPPPEQNRIQICDWLREFPSSLFSFRLLIGPNGNAEQKDSL